MTSLAQSIQRLTDFWRRQGCLWIAPCDLAVPVATMHPRAFFSLLEPGAWRAVFAQPVRRPADGRQGLHPFRLARHHQLQVLWQDEVDDPLGLWTESLGALDIDVRHHDLRFDEWRWRARALGATGRGWHARLDGLGVSRITFLERLAGRPLEPVGLEISYGLERLGMAAHGLRDVYRLAWNAQDEDGERRRRREEQESRWVSELADVERLRRRLEDLETEARRAIEHGLELTAYELAIECLPLIDVLEARDEMLGRERQAWLDRVRALVGAAAELHLEGATGSKEPSKEPSEEADDG